MMEINKLSSIVFSYEIDYFMLCVFGIIISAYSLYVETKKLKDKNYVAMCDFNEHMSCSKVLTSEYSIGFGFVKYLVGEKSMMNQPNCLLGIFFYLTMLFLGMMVHPMAAYASFYLCLVSVVGSFYLGYILFFILKDLCIVCIATYIVNFSLLYLSYQKYSVMP